jgi:hypothetical protein
MVDVFIFSVSEAFRRYVSSEWDVLVLSLNQFVDLFTLESSVVIGYDSAESSAGSILAAYEGHAWLTLPEIKTVLNDISSGRAVGSDQ